MKLSFIGTRGYIEAETRRHRRHTSTMVTYQRRRVLIDYGEDWRGRAEDLGPNAIVITHPHPDHAFGLRAGAPCPVYAIAAAWKTMEGFPVPEDYRRTLHLRHKRRIEGIELEPFSVVHSTRAPAVGYRIVAGRASVFYVPDVVDIHEREEALAGIDVYVGDGARIIRPLIRRDRKSGVEIGHTSIRTQLDWCREAGVSRMIVTHCGSEIVRADERKLRPRLEAMAAERGVQLELAYDGMERIL